MPKKIIHAQEYSYTALYEPVKEGGYRATVPLLRGLITYGRTLEEARDMSRDAIRCHLGAMKKDHEEIPHEFSLLQVRVSVKI